MILPSDEDPRKPGDSDPPEKESDDAVPWEESPDDLPGFFDEDDDIPPDTAGKVQSPAPPGWREDLKEDLEEALEDLKEIEDPAEDFDPPEPPDLFTFYGELVALRNEMRRASRKAAEVFQQFPEGKTKPATTGKALADSLVSLFDHIEAAEKSVPRQLSDAMKLAGLQRVKTKGADFDPATMTTGGPASSGAKVVLERQSGWLLNGSVLRPALVTLA